MLTYRSGYDSVASLSRGHFRQDLKQLAPTLDRRFRLAFRPPSSFTVPIWHLSGQHE